MAFTNGDVVTMSLFGTLGVSGLLGPLVQGQPPKFGVVADNGGVDVLWESGFLQPDIPANELDLIGSPTTGDVTAFQGKIVKVASESPEYQGIVVSLYTRDQGGAGSPSGTLALIFTNFETYREVPVASLVAVAGR